MLPSPDVLERLCVSLATLDVIISPEWESRYFSFDQSWGNKKGHRMGSMRNGSGDEYYILFTASGTAIKGYAHDYPMANPGTPPRGVVTDFPPSIEGFLSEPAFTMDCTTFCIWRLPGQTWTIGDISYPNGDDPDGSEFLLAELSGKPRDYQAFAENYYEQDVPIETVEAIYAHEPLTAELALSLNRATRVDALAEDFAKIGYPQA